jgi:hypothetical protein
MKTTPLEPRIRCEQLKLGSWAALQTIMFHSLLQKQLRPRLGKAQQTRGRIVERDRLVSRHRSPA